MSDKLENEQNYSAHPSVVRGSRGSAGSQSSMARVHEVDVKNAAEEESPLNDVSHDNHPHAST